MEVFSRTEAYDKVHFAVMAIENGGICYRRHCGSFTKQGG